MNTVKKLLGATAALCALGTLSAPGTLSALEALRAGASDEVADAATAEASDPNARFTSSISTSYSFAEVVNLSDVGETLRSGSEATGRVRAGSIADLSNGAKPMPTRLGGTNASNSLLGELSALNGAFGDLTEIAVPNDFFASRSSASRSPVDGRFLFTSANVPEPADWMTLLCGVVVVAFMARRKRGLLAD